MYFIVYITGKQVIRDHDSYTRILIVIMNWIHNFIEIVCILMHVMYGFSFHDEDLQNRMLLLQIESNDVEASTSTISKI